MATTLKNKAGVTARKAASLESDGQWSMAKFFWGVAKSQLANSGESSSNAKWYQSREQHCHTQAILHDDDA